MKILLVAVNAKYIHSNLGIYSLIPREPKIRSPLNWPSTPSTISWTHVCRIYTGESPM